jgi:aldose 1-epimerase
MSSFLTRSQLVEQDTVQLQPFGPVFGQPVYCYILRNDDGVEAKLTNFGATLISLRVPDRLGNFDDVVLGYNDIDGYANGTTFLGATIGRYANRIAGGKFSLNGNIYTLSQNNGKNSLHGGQKGFHKVVWEEQAILNDAGSAVQFTYLSKDGEEGYPGNLLARVTYTLTPSSELRLDYDVTADQDTVQNLTHHSYFNLAPTEPNILGHELTLHSDCFTPVDENLIPTGELRTVERSPFDFRNRTRIGARVSDANEQLERGKGYDHNWVVNGEAGKLRLAAQVYEPGTGRAMEVTTTEPGIQFYSGNFLSGELGKNGKRYGPRTGFCLETQHFPDSPNHPNFPTTILKAGNRYQSSTVYKFEVN